ncbi:MAG: AraC family transcriptional regulator [Dysgonamonadaceae bacterium]|jgi:AraC-like DNA-binding protein|nr:AraC family transcriptional regulator [Dysgonamonadaceae bacterium]
MKKKENIDLILLNIARKEHDADWNWKNVNSPFARLYMVEQGTAGISLPDGFHTIRPGYLYLVPSFVTHSYENPDFFVLYYLHIYDKNNLLDLMSYPFEVEASENDYSLIRRLLAINPNRALATSDPLIYDNFQNLMKGISEEDRISLHRVMETRGILLQLFSRFMERAVVTQTITDERIERAVNYIRTRIDTNISIDELSGLFHLTKEHFIRLFKQDMQCSPLQYINRKKIEKAQLLLTMGRYTVKDVALSLAFSDVSHFFKTFKRMTGVSPDQFKQMQNRY